MDKDQIAVACAAEQVKLDGAPTEIKILPLGLVKNTHQDFLVDDASCESIIQQFKGRKLDLVIDYEHQTLKDIQAPAAGWIKDIRKGTDALIATVEWTKKAAEYLQNKEYRYLSPVVLVRAGKAIAIHSVALTNTPAIDGMYAIVNSAGFPAENIDQKKEGGTEMNLAQKLAEMLGLPAEATEEDVAKAVEALLKQEEAKKTEPDMVANKTILQLLGLKDDAKTEDVAAQIQALKAGGTDVAAELLQLKESLAKKDATNAVETALKAGKITAAQKEWAEAYALKDPTGFQSFCDKAVQAVPVGKVAYKSDSKSGSQGTIDMAVLKNLGLSKEDLEKYGEKEEME